MHDTHNIYNSHTHHTQTQSGATIKAGCGAPGDVQGKTWASYSEKVIWATPLDLSICESDKNMQLSNGWLDVIMWLNHNEYRLFYIKDQRQWYYYEEESLP